MTKNNESIDLIVKNLKTKLATSCSTQPQSSTEVFKDKSNETNTVSQEDNLCELGYN